MAADRFATRAETMKLDQQVRALEEEGRSKGFTPAGQRGLLGHADGDPFGGF